MTGESANPTVTKTKNDQVSDAREARERAKLKRAVGIIFGRAVPKKMTRADVDDAIDRFIDEAKKATSTFVALKTTGSPMSAATIALLRKIAVNAERWQRQLNRSRPAVLLPHLDALRFAASRKADLYMRRRGKSVDSVRHGLVGELYDAYVEACPWSRRGFQPVANAVLAGVGLPMITKHEMAQLQAQISAFSSLDTNAR